MDRMQAISEMTPEQIHSVAKRRLETFQFRAPSGIQSSSSLGSMSSGRRRPHSRNGSVTSMTFSHSTNSLSSTMSDVSPTLSSPSDSRPHSTSSGRSRPSSHHRRRSSVSTRVESAEIMRISLTNLPSSYSDENINFGDKDSIRRRALLALEGRGELGASGSKVEIPDLDDLEHPKETQKLEPISKLQANVTSGAYSCSSSLSTRRDSFGKLSTPSSSLKDQLHTLLEEEEEEDHNIAIVPPQSREQQGSITIVVPTIKHGHYNAPTERRKTPTAFLAAAPTSSSQPISPSRSKPANLALKPLTLAPTPQSTGLLTPAISPNSRTQGLKALTLTTSEPVTTSCFFSPSASPSPERSPALKPIEAKAKGVASPSKLTVKADNQTSQERLGTFQYVRSTVVALPAVSYANSALPTPGSTPTSERRLSSSSTATSDSDSLPIRDRRSFSDDIFMHQSHIALLSRIADLERALLARSVPTSKLALPEPSEEMLALVADLKSERDQLVQDVEGWRMRVENLEEGKGKLAQAVEAEKNKVRLKEEKEARMELENAAVVRQLKERLEEVNGLSSRVTLLQSQLADAERLHYESRNEADRLQRRLAEANSALQTRSTLEAELNKTRSILLQEQTIRQQLEQKLSKVVLFPNSSYTNDFSDNMSTRGLGIHESVDSTGTRVGSPDIQQSVKGPFTLKPVEEEDEHDSNYSEDEDALAGYEDEEDSDVSFTCQSRSLSSSSLEDERPRSVHHLQVAAQTLSSSPSPSPSPCPTPTSYPLVAQGPSRSSHERRTSLSKTWKFPSADQACTPRREEVDHFFECLDDMDDSPPLASVRGISDKNAFSEALRRVEEQDCISLPPIDPTMHAGDRRSLLEVVVEVNEEEFDEDVGSIELGHAIHGSLGFGNARSSFPISVSDDSLSLSSHGHSQDYASSVNSSCSAIIPLLSSGNGVSSAVSRSELPQSPLQFVPASQDNTGTPRSGNRMFIRSFPVKEVQMPNALSSPSKVVTPREPCVSQFASRLSQMQSVKLSSPPPAKVTSRLSPKQTQSPGITFYAAPTSRSPSISTRNAEPSRRSPQRVYPNGSTLIPQLKPLNYSSPSRK